MVYMTVCYQEIHIVLGRETKLMFCLTVQFVKILVFKVPRKSQYTLLILMKTRFSVLFLNLEENEIESTQIE